MFPAPHPRVQLGLGCLPHPQWVLEPHEPAQSLLQLGQGWSRSQSLPEHGSCAQRKGEDLFAPCSDINPAPLKVPRHIWIMTWNNLGSRRFRVPVTAACLSGDAASRGRAAYSATLRSFSFSAPSPQLHKANPAAETCVSRWHHLLSEETEGKAALKSVLSFQGQPVALPLCSGGFQPLLLLGHRGIAANCFLFRPVFFPLFPHQAGK